MAGGNPGALPAHEGTLRRPGDDPVDTEFGGRLDGELIAIALREGLWTSQIAAARIGDSFREKWATPPACQNDRVALSRVGNSGRRDQFRHTIEGTPNAGMGHSARGESGS